MNQRERDPHPPTTPLRFGYDVPQIGEQIWGNENTMYLTQVAPYP